MAKDRLRLAFLLGTRPEAIKLAPVIRSVRESGSDAVIISTGQHPKMLIEALHIFGIYPDLDLGLFRVDQSLSTLLSDVVLHVGDYLASSTPDALVIQGDTTSAVGGALAASYAKIGVVHVEAGLRTGEKAHPFPEEVNRRVIAACGDLHLAPTLGAAENLFAEGIRPDSVHVTGNTVIDALQFVRSRLDISSVRPELRDFLSSGRRTVLVTTHRREVWGEVMRGMLAGILDAADSQKDVQVLLPGHPNPLVREIVTSTLGSSSKCYICSPLKYDEFVLALSECYLVATDSGGVQEEAPAFGKPVLILRDVTERPEGVMSGAAKLVGTNPGNIRRSLLELLTSQESYASMARVRNPYGDGGAAERCVSAIREFLRSK